MGTDLSFILHSEHINSTQNAFPGYRHGTCSVQAIRLFGTGVEHAPCLYPGNALYARWKKGTSSSRAISAFKRKNRAVGKVIGLFQGVWRGCPGRLQRSREVGK